MNWLLEELIDDGVPTPRKVGWGFTVMYWSAGIAAAMFVVNFARTYLRPGG